MLKPSPRKSEILLEYQDYIQNSPVAPAQMYSQACQNDNVTINSWRQIWIKNVTDNHTKYGSFKDNSAFKFFGSQRHKPVIIAGAGPSLKFNGKELKNKKDICLVSCLHNYHYLEDLGVETDFFMTLDAGEVVVEEVHEGGTKSADYYWDSTKDKKLVAYIGTSPRLLEKWKGEVYFYNAPVPDPEYEKTVMALEPFNCYISNGGNVLGACLYYAKCLGAGPVGFVGADFSFSYERKFHGWDSKYDKDLGYTVNMIDIFGNKVKTWQSYANFAAWFNYIAETVPGIYVNCTEGGVFGSYPQGNIMSVKQMDLASFIRMFNVYEEVKDQAIAPETAQKKILF